MTVSPRHDPTRSSATSAGNELQLLSSRLEPVPQTVWPMEGKGLTRSRRRCV